MKKIFLLFFVFAIISTSFSQNDISKKDMIIALLKMNDNSKIFTELVSINIESIPVQKRVDFQKEVEEVASKKKKEALAFFLKRYSEKDIDKIYSEYSVPNRFAYSQKTLSFLREWKTYKMLFQKEFKKIFSRY